MEEMPLSKKNAEDNYDEDSTDQDIIDRAITKSTHFLGTGYHCWPHATDEKHWGTSTPNAGEHAEQQELSFIADGNAKTYSHFGRQFGHFLQN